MPRLRPSSLRCVVPLWALASALVMTSASTAMANPFRVPTVRGSGQTRLQTPDGSTELRSGANGAQLRGAGTGLFGGGTSLGGGFGTPRLGAGRRLSLRSGGSPGERFLDELGLDELQIRLVDLFAPKDKKRRDRSASSRDTGANTRTAQNDAEPRQTERPFDGRPASEPATQSGFSGADAPTPTAAAYQPTASAPSSSDGTAAATSAGARASLPFSSTDYWTHRRSGGTQEEFIAEHMDRGVPFRDMVEAVAKWEEEFGSGDEHASDGDASNEGTEV